MTVDMPFIYSNGDATFCLIKQREKIGFNLKETDMLDIGKKKK